VPKDVPAATVGRLPTYLRCLNELSGRTVSSEQLAKLARVNSAKVRKDLSYLGSYGTRGVGYDVEHLKHQISRELGLTHDWQVAIVGVGNLGSALANYAGFGQRGFVIAGLFDTDKRKVGRKLGGLEVEPLSNLEGAVADRGLTIGILTTPADSAQEVAEYMVAAGLKSILNFAPTAVDLPPDVEVRRVDLSKELQMLSYYMSRS
jgi:redox-sensing transcriptional repressor